MAGAPGVSSAANSARFSSDSTVFSAIPVALPPGRAMFVPASRRMSAACITIGMVAVAARAD